MAVLHKGKIAKVSKARQAELVNICRNWAMLCSHLDELSSDDLAKAIHIEFRAEKRPHILRRLAGRYNKIHATTVRQELGLI
jgi:hypothetical protein